MKSRFPRMRANTLDNFHRSAGHWQPRRIFAYGAAHPRWNWLPVRCISCGLGVIVRALKRWIRIASTCAAVLVPSASLAAVPSCGGLAPTFPANYSAESSRLLLEMRDDARRVTDAIPQLPAFSDNSRTSWQFHAAQLIGIREQVRDMETKLCRLQVIEHVVTSEQEHTIRSVVGPVRSLAKNLQNAAAWINAREGQLWSPSYKLYTENLSKEAAQAITVIENGEQL